MNKGYEIVLREAPLDAGLCKADVLDLTDLLTDDSFIPIEIQGEYSTAMGFISLSAAEKMSYLYDDLETFVKGILNDMSKEDETCEYWLKVEPSSPLEKNASLYSVWLSR